MVVTCGESHFLFHRGTLSLIIVSAAPGLVLGLCLCRPQTYFWPRERGSYLGFGFQWVLGPSARIGLSIRAAYSFESGWVYNRARDQGSSGSYSQDTYKGTGSMKIFSH